MIHALIFFILLLSASAFARAGVGSGKLHRWIVYPIVSSIVALTVFGVTIPAAIVAVAATCNVAFGRTDWYNKRYMAVRYSLLPLVATFSIVVMFAVSPVLFIWPLLSAVVGWFYGDMKDWIAWLMYDEQIPEAIAGAVLIGLPAVLLFI